MDGSRPAQAGSASVEQVGLVALIAVMIAVLIAAIVASDDLDSTPGLGRAIATKIVCAPRAHEARRHLAPTEQGSEVPFRPPLPLNTLSSSRICANSAETPA